MYVVSFRLIHSSRCVLTTQMRSCNSCSITQCLSWNRYAFVYDLYVWYSEYPHFKSNECACFRYRAPPCSTQQIFHKFCKLFEIHENSLKSLKNQGTSLIRSGLYPGTTQMYFSQSLRSEVTIINRNTYMHNIYHFINFCM